MRVIKLASSQFIYQLVSQSGECCQFDIKVFSMPIGVRPKGAWYFCRQSATHLDNHSFQDHNPVT